MTYREFYNKLGQLGNHRWLVEREDKSFLDIYYRDGVHMKLAYSIHLTMPFMLISTIDNRKMLEHANYSQKVYTLCSCLASTQIDKRGKL